MSDASEIEARVTKLRAWANLRLVFARRFASPDPSVRDELRTEAKMLQYVVDILDGKEAP